MTIGLEGRGGKGGSDEARDQEKRIIAPAKAKRKKVKGGNPIIWDTNKRTSQIYSLGHRNL